MQTPFLPRHQPVQMFPSPTTGLHSPQHCTDPARSTAVGTGKEREGRGGLPRRGAGVRLSHRRLAYSTRGKCLGCSGFAQAGVSQAGRWGGGRHGQGARPGCRQSCPTLRTLMHRKAARSRRAGAASPQAGSQGHPTPARPPSCPQPSHSLCPPPATSTLASRGAAWGSLLHPRPFPYTQPDGLLRSLFLRKQFAKKQSKPPVPCQPPCRLPGPQCPLPGRPLRSWHFHGGLLCRG